MIIYRDRHRHPWVWRQVVRTQYQCSLSHLQQLQSSDITNYPTRGLSFIIYLLYFSGRLSLYKMAKQRSWNFRGPTKFPQCCMHVFFCQNMVIWDQKYIVFAKIPGRLSLYKMLKQRSRNFPGPTKFPWSCWCCIHVSFCQNTSIPTK